MKKVIVRVGSDWEATKAIVAKALELGATDFCCDKNAEKIRKLGNVSIWSRSAEVKPDFMIAGEASKGGIVEIEVSKKQDEQKVIDAAKRGAQTVIVTANNWKVIPFENLISELHTSNTKLIADVSSLEEAHIMLETLEIGVDGILVSPKSAEDVSKMIRLVKENQEVKLEVAEIVELVDCGTGDRVCIDTCSILENGEGVLVGSQSSGCF